MKLKQSIFEALALLVLACVVGVVFNAQRSAGLVLTRDYFPALTGPQSELTDPQSGPTGPQGSGSVDAPISDEGQLPQHGFNVVSLPEALEYYSRGESSIVFIDARDDAHYAQCHIPSAIQFDYYRPDEYIDNVRDFAADAEIVIIYCNGGECEDSIQAARYLIEEIEDPLPFEIVYVFEGGIQEWYEAGNEREPENCEP
ncbi:MAG: rhodanese-like domain-containing protein [Planctomycetes bacterium]|nr:rhodanese-like domain-containing protein [Planctomycetota bacterium]